MKKQSLRIIPISTLGKWSVALIVLMPILFYIGTLLASSLYESVPAGATILEDIIQRPVLSLTMLAAMGAGIFAFITGLVAIITKKENALLVYISTVIGAFLLFFLGGEVISPH